MALTTTDRKIISALSGDLPEDLAPFQQIALRVGVSEPELLDRLRHLRRSGFLRRFGATVDQRQLGRRGNAMIVWGVPRERLKEVAGVISASPFVSHCYARKAQPSWPYNLYAMVHATADEECGKIAADLSLALGIHDYRLLFTVREFKKVSPQYFGQRSSEETSL